MKTLLNPYIGFKDTTRDAMEFYKSVFVGNLVLSTFKESHASKDPSDDNKIMHAMLTTEAGMVIMASDTPSSMEYKPAAGISLSLSGDNEEELKGYFDKLKTGGTEVMPLVKADWGDMFGMLVDKFGVQWMVNISAPKEA